MPELDWKLLLDFFINRVIILRGGFGARKRNIAFFIPSPARPLSASLI